jgi:hypothetical protein
MKIFKLFVMAISSFTVFLPLSSLIIITHITPFALPFALAIIAGVEVGQWKASPSAVIMTASQESTTLTISSLSIPETDSLPLRSTAQVEETIDSCHALTSSYTAPNNSVVDILSGQPAIGSSSAGQLNVDTLKLCLGALALPPNCHVSNTKTRMVHVTSGRKFHALMIARNGIRKSGGFRWVWFRILLTL